MRLHTAKLMYSWSEEGAALPWDCLLMLLPTPLSCCSSLPSLRARSHLLLFPLLSLSLSPPPPSSAMSDSACSSPCDSPSASPEPNPLQSPHLPVTLQAPTVDKLVEDTAKSHTEDPSMRLSKERVAAARADKSGRVYRVYCDGVFDLFHLGHARMLEQAKKSLGDAAKVYLLAGICSDEDVHRFKGKTVMDHKLRGDSVVHCKWVDEVLMDAPWVIQDEYLQQHNIGQRSSTGCRALASSRRED